MSFQRLAQSEEGPTALASPAAPAVRAEEQRLVRDEEELADVALQGHSHTADTSPPVTGTYVAVPSPTPSPDAAPPIPQYSFRSLMLLFMVVVADGIALHIIVPFISPMCEERFGIGSEAVGAAAGLLLGSFSMAVLLSSFIIGHLSDLYGRRKFLLLGLASSAVCPLIFGVTTSFAVALLSRILSGITNANLVLTKTVISDVPSSQLSPERRALSFAYLSGVFQLSRALASALAGLTVGIEVGGYDNPYFLPNLLAALFNLTILILSWMFLPESLKTKKETKVPEAPSAVAAEAGAATAAEKEVLQHQGVQLTVMRAPRAQSSKYERVLNVGEEEGEEGEDEPSNNPHQMRIVVTGSSSSPFMDASPSNEDAATLSRASTAEAEEAGSSPSPSSASASAGHNNGNNQLLRPPSPPSRNQSVSPTLLAAAAAEAAGADPDAHTGCLGNLAYVWQRLSLGMAVVRRDHLLLKLILLQSLHAFANGGFMLLLSLFGALALEDNGMNMSPGEIGACYVAFGGVSLCFQLFAYKHAHKALGLYRLYQVGTLLLGVAGSLLPMGGLVKRWEVARAEDDYLAGLDPAAASPDAAAPFDPSTLPASAFVWSWLYMALSLFGMACGFMICLPVIGGMMSLAVQGSAFRGLTLGVSQSCQSGFRGIGATIMGALFSYVARNTGWPALVFWLLASLNFTAFVVAWHFTPEQIKTVTGETDRTMANAAATAAVTAAAASASTTTTAATVHTSAAETAAVDGDEEEQLHPGALSSDASVLRDVSMEDDLEEIDVEELERAQALEMGEPVTQRVH